jgi:hypothetical protein
MSTQQRRFVGRYDTARREWCVDVVDGDVTRPLEIRGLDGGRYPPHSPTGHAWGYGGSGPAQLAHDLLWAALGFEPTADMYHAYKAAVIARLPIDQGFELTEGQVVGWIIARLPSEPGWPRPNPPEAYVTKTGRVMTDAEIEALADEAERGYDVSGLQGHRRPRGGLEDS